MKLIGLSGVLVLVASMSAATIEEDAGTSAEAEREGILANIGGTFCSMPLAGTVGDKTIDADVVKLLTGLPGSEVQPGPTDQSVQTSTC